VTDPLKFQPWKVGQVLCKAIYAHLGSQFQWKQPPYEYEYQILPIDIINGSDQLRLWVERDGSYQELLDLERSKWGDFEERRNSVLLYE